MGNFVMAVAHLIMAIGAFGYKNPSLLKSINTKINCHFQRRFSNENRNRESVSTVF